jgi:hypothetical protein
MKEKPSYVEEILDEVFSKDPGVPEMKDAIIKRVMSGYSIISDEISKEHSEEHEKGIRF